MHYIVDKVDKGNCVAKNDKHNVQLTMAQQASCIQFTDKHTDKEELERSCRWMR